MHDRIEALLGRMTIDEKVGQLNQVSAGLPTGPGTQRAPYTTEIEAGRIGTMLNVTDGELADAYQKIAVEESRLGIPLIFALDVIHGFRTIVPVPLGLAATWDPDLVEQTARLAAIEAAAQGIRWTFSPMVDIARDARWGRITEGSGEDPYLAAVFASAFVRGYQGDGLDRPGSILACAKHFAAYGAAEGGRDYNTTEVSQRSLRQVYLPPFQAAIQAGVATVMTGFNALNGVPVSANAFLLDEVLRKEWGFGGLVVSDWQSILELIAHGVADDKATAAGKAFLAGVDLDMEGGVYLAELPDLVQKGVVPMELLDDAVRRVLRAKIALGLFDNPYRRPGVALPDDEPLPSTSLDLARVAAERSFVLLRNAPFQESRVLPLDPARIRSIALVGPLADSATDMLGSWSAQGRASDVTTLRAALAARAALERMKFRYEPGLGGTGKAAAGIDAARRVARNADVVVLALGEKGHLTGEAASRTRLDLDQDQQALLQAMVDTGKPVILILFNGRPLTVTWAASHVPAIIEAWFPGVQAGPALVRTLFGDVNPSGRLTVTFPRTVGQIPLYYNTLTTGRPPPLDLDLGRPPADGPERFFSRYIDEFNAPLFPFGHGLSYTTFRFSATTSDLESIQVAALNDGKATLTVHAEVTNTGKLAGTAVAQLYIRLTGTTVARPARELKGFQRVDLDPGQTRQVRFTLGREALAFWNLDMEEVVEPATLQVWIAPDSVAGTPVTVKLTDPRTWRHRSGAPATRQ
jgi:beta-glucosidase